MLSQGNHANRRDLKRQLKSPRAADEHYALLSGIAHEMRTPLASIRVQLEVALNSKGRPSWKQIGQDVLKETRRLSKLVEDMLLLSRLELEAEHVNIGRSCAVDLAGLVMDSVDRYAGARVPITVDAPDSYMICGVVEDLSRMVTNLIDNAVEWAGTHVEVSLANQAGWVILEVSDDGIDIPSSQLKRVFEPFYRLDEARSRADDERSGAGLGLSIVQAIAGIHNGSAKLKVKSPGVTAVVRLPAIKERRQHSRRTSGQMS